MAVSKHRLRIGGRLRKRAARVTSGVGDFITDQPLAAGAATLALGLLAGLALPSTRREDEWLGGRRDELLQDVKQSGREALARGKELAREAVETAVETLREELDFHGVTSPAAAEPAGQA